MRKRRVATAVALLTVVGSTSLPIAAHAVSSATTFYVNNTASADCSDSTTDSAVAPYCTIQAAVNAATAPGDTVSVYPGAYVGFSMTASGSAAAPITVEALEDVGYTTSTFIESASGGSPAAVSISGASNVTVAGFHVLESTGQPDVDITGSSNVTVDSSWISEVDTNVPHDQPAVWIHDGSSKITISRDTIRSPASAGDVVTEGGSSDVITTDSFDPTTPGPVVSLDQTPDSDVTSNTILLQDCLPAITAGQGSSGVTFQNNLLETSLTAANACAASGNTPATAAIQVDATSTAGSTVDYNTIHYSDAATTGTTPTFLYYAWAGTGYDSSTAFNAATGQSAHDSNSADPTEVIDSANSDAPGELTTDINGEPRVDDPDVPNTGTGQYSYYDRGAQETGDAFTIGASAAFSATTLVGTPTDVSVPVSDDWAGQTIVDCTFNFDDGTVLVSQPPVDGACSAQHTYSSLGVYYWNLTVTASDGVTKPVGGDDTVVASGILRPNLGLTALSSRTVQASATPTDSYGWSIVQCLFDFGDGTTSIVSPAGGRSCVGTHTYAAVGTFPVSMTVTDSQGETATETLDFGADGYYFDPTVPVRVLDTRKPIGVSSIAKVGPGGIVKLKLAGTNGIPADAGAVALNLTATNGTANGFVTVLPDGTTPPTSSNLNFAASQTVPNTVVVKLGDDGTVDLKNNSTGTTDLVADLDGYYAPSGAGYVPQSPSRLIDTRTTHQTIAPNGTLRVYLGTTGAPAAVLNVTATDPTSNGFITAYPDGQAIPNASNVNYGPHQTIANEVTVQAGGNGYVDFKNESSGSVDLIVDLSGLFESGSGSPFVPIAPERLLDTRTGLGVLNGVGAGALPAGGTGDLMLWNSPIPDAGVAAVENVTVTEPQKNGYVLAYPEFGGSRPIGSTLNFAPGQTVANSATVALGIHGAEALYNGSTGSTQLVVDLFGYYF